jgi:peptide/nickel transport system ATP-binding protein
MTPSPVLSVEDVSRAYTLPRRGLFQPQQLLQAVRTASFTLGHGETLGIVGESGSGKSTLARMIMGFEKPDAGRIAILGQDIHAMPARDLVHLRRQVQMVFQDPFSSLDPRKAIGWSIAEPLLADRSLSAGQRQKRVLTVLDQVGLRAADAGKFPHQFSGGQRQRIAIARAIVTRPKLLVADEPVSALDVSMQGQILNLLTDLQADMGLSLVFISHDLALVGHLCDRVIVMRKGEIVESGQTDDVMHTPQHAYTRELMSHLVA